MFLYQKILELRLEEISKIIDSHFIIIQIGKLSLRTQKLICSQEPTS